MRIVVLNKLSCLMNTIKLLFLLFPILTWAQSNNPIILNKGTVTLAGQIKDASQRTMNVISLELVGRENHLVRLAQDGSFKVTIKMLSSHSNYLSYDNKLISFFSAPGDSIYIEANASNFKKTATFSGDNFKVNQCIRYFNEAYVEVRNSLELYDKKRNAPPEEFKKVLTLFSTQMATKIDSIYELTEAGESALGWMQSKMKYQIAEELLEYGRKHEDELPSDYYSFTKSYENASLMDLKCPQYYESYINKYYYGYKYRILSDELKEFRNFINEGKIYLGLTRFFEIINKNVTDQIAKELILTRICNDYSRDNYEAVDSVFSSFTKLVHTEDYRKLIKSNIIEKRIEKSAQRTIDDLMALESIGELFSEIQKKHPNEVLYIDLWGTWCKPCFTEFPFSSKLHGDLKDHPIEFVYLGCKSDQSNWEDSIDKFGLKGTHYLLSEDQYNELSEQFNLIGFPRYIVIDKNGIIVDEDAKRPSNEDIKAELLTLANK